MKLIKPLFLLGSVTFVLTVILYYLTHLPVWSLICFSVIVQFLGNYIYQSILITYAGIKLRQAEAEALKELSFQTIEVECPCSLKTKQVISLRLNEDTQYKCIQCQKTLNAIVDVTSTLATIPTKNDAETFDKLLQEGRSKAPTQNEN